MSWMFSKSRSMPHPVVREKSAGAIGRSNGLAPEQIRDAERDAGIVRPERLCLVRVENRRLIASDSVIRVRVRYPVQVVRHVDSQLKPATRDITDAGAERQCKAGAE